MKSSLPDNYENSAYLGLHYQFQVDIHISTRIEDRDEREIGQYAVGEILQTVYNSSSDEDQQIKVGEISGYRLLGEISAIWSWADYTDQDLSIAVDWLASQSGGNNDICFIQDFFYLDKVRVNPEWRGKGFTLKAVATYLEILANGSFVFLMPVPLEKIENSKTRERQIIRLCRFWQKLGMDNYDKEANILWHSEWSCPQWLSGKYSPTLRVQPDY